MLFSVVATLFFIPTNSAQRFQFLHILANTCYSLVFCIFVLVVVILVDVRWCLIRFELHVPDD